MALIRKVRQIGNSLALAIPNELFDFLEINPSEIKYKLYQNETGQVYVIILEKDVYALDEKNFQKRGTSYTFIIPKSLCTMWNIGLGEDQSRELALSFDESPLKWRLSPV